MTVYPVMLTNVAGARTVVVGGGRVAERKVRGLLAVNAQVCVVSPALTQGLGQLHAMGQIDWIARPYRHGDLAGARLVFATTDQRSVNAMVGQDAVQAGIFCNVADAPEEGTFHVPAVYRHDDLVVAVGTGGRDPGRSKAVRNLIATTLFAPPAPAK